METGDPLTKLRRLRDARATCIELFLDALVAVQTTPHRLRRCNGSVRRRTVESYRRLRSGRVP